MLVVLERTKLSSLIKMGIGCELGRVENSKTFQNQMFQCFFIGLYDIETGDNFYFLQNFFLMGGNGF